MQNTQLKFALVTTFYPPFHFGGDAIYVQNQAQALVKRGHTVDVIHTIDPYIALGGDQTTPADLDQNNITVYRLRSKYPRLSCLLTHQLGAPIAHRKKIKDLLSHGKYDVVHFHNISLVGGPRVLRYGSGIKIYTAHEHWLVCPTHILWKNDREICQSKACIRCSIKYRRPPQFWRYTNLLKRSAEHVDAFLALSDFSAKAHHRFGFKSPFHKFPSTVPSTLESNTKPPGINKGHQKPYFLYVGRLEAIKGIQDIIPVFRNFPEAELTIAGDGSLESELKRLAGNTSNINFLGKVGQSSLTNLYRGAVAVVVPSRCIEVFPLVVLEAIREGTPVLARDTGPLPEIIDESGSGATFKDATQLKEKLELMLNNASYHSKVSSAALKSFQNRWTEEKVYCEYFSIIKKIAEEQNNLHLLSVLAECSADGHLQNETYVRLPA